jgi:hypothetical protein
MQQYETYCDRNIRIKSLESVINTVFHRNYGRILVQWIQDYEDAFTELILIEKTWNDDEIKKRQLVKNAKSVGLDDTTFEDLISDNHLDTCNFLKSHAIRLYQQYKENFNTNQQF